MTKSFHSCHTCAGKHHAKEKGMTQPTVKRPVKNKIRIWHGVNASNVAPTFEGFTDTDCDFVRDFVLQALSKFRGKPASSISREEIESTTLSAMKEISDDEYAIHWNTWSDRVSFTIYAKATNYEPRFAPGCTITVI